jgi:hypothetical protein
MSYTRVHTSVTFADPFLVCGDCGERAEGFHDPYRCGCEGTFHLKPCHHVAEPVSTCPSWSPVDGCRCPDPVKDHASPSEPTP